MNAVESRAKIVKAAKNLMAGWQQTKEVWRDENCRQFEKKYMAPLEVNIRATLLRMERMGAMLEKAQHDCRDDTGSGA